MMGFCDSLSRGWAFITQAIHLAWSERSLLKPSIYMVLANIVYCCAWVGLLLALDVDMESDNGVFLGALATLGSFFIFYFFSAMTVHMVDVHLAGRTPNLGQAFDDARHNVGAILTLAVISTIVELLASAVRRNSDRGIAGIVMRIVASIIESLWCIVSFLLLPAIIIENISLRQALDRVRALHRGHALLIGVGEVGVRAVTNLIGFAVMVVFIAAIYGSIALVGGNAGVFLAFTAGGTILALFAAFSTFVRTAYYTCLYLWAVEVEDQGNAARAPLPLAVALER